MKRISTVIGLITLAMVPGQAPGHRDIRPPARYRAGATPSGARTAQMRAPRLDAGALADAASSTSRLVPVAIDSETGEPCWISAKLAGFLRHGRTPRRA